MTRSLPPVALPLIASFIVFGAVAMANLHATGWLDLSTDQAGGLQPAPQPAPGTDRARTRCAACGVIQSIRRIEAAGDTAESYEITVRLRDGSVRVSTDASPARWRAGDNIILIGGVNSAGEPIRSER